MFVFFLSITLLVSSVVCNPLYSNYTSIFIDGEEHDLVGDMVFRKDQNPYRSNSSKSYNADTNNRWPTRAIPYYIDPRSGYTPEEILVIQWGLYEITVKTGGCINFYPRTTEPSYITFRHTGTGCNSHVGQVSKDRDQQISIDRPHCVDNGVVVHETIHALGFDHEHNRPDRDFYIWIDFSNMEPLQHPAFNKQTTWSTLNLPYDYFSIMHYTQDAYAINPRKPTIYSRFDYIDMSKTGNKQHMNDMDAKKVKALYGCK